MKQYRSFEFTQPRAVRSARAVAGKHRWNDAGKAFAGLLLSAAIASPAMAPADESGLVTYRSLTPDAALRLAQAAQAACRARDFQVSVAVVDRGGMPQVTLRDQLAGNFTYAVAVRKAATAAGFRQSTLELAQTMRSRPELEVLHQLDDVLMVGGGVPVEAQGAVVGAVAVSGAPTPEDDHACAVAGIEALADVLPF